jgi:ankyrin repeat protein
MGKTPLMSAAESGHDYVIKLLIDGGANIESRHKHGLTALALAAEASRLSTVHLLLDHGADVQSKNNDGHVALDWASNYVVRTLLSRHMQGAETQYKYENKRP